MLSEALGRSYSTWLNTWLGRVGSSHNPPYAILFPSIGDARHGCPARDGRRLVSAARPVLESVGAEWVSAPRRRSLPPVEIHLESFAS